MATSHREFTFDEAVEALIHLRNNRQDASLFIFHDRYTDRIEERAVLFTSTQQAEEELVKFKRVRDGWSLEPLFNCEFVGKHGKAIYDEINENLYKIETIVEKKKSKKPGKFITRYTFSAFDKKAVAFLKRKVVHKND